MAALLMVFLFWGSYTKRSTVGGQLVPDTGLVKVYAPQAGIVRCCRRTCTHPAAASALSGPATMCCCAIKHTYQRFGHAKGTVAHVSKTALPINEISVIGNMAAGNKFLFSPLFA